MNENIYKTAIDNIKFSENLSSKTLDYLASYPSHPEKDKAVRKVKHKIAYASLAAAACALVIGIPMLKAGPDFKLTNSVGNISVQYVDKAPSSPIHAKLASFTEEELFHKFDTDIFKGEIKDIKDIKIDFNGQIIYKAIAKIKVDETYRGNVTAGKTVSILLPGAIDPNAQMEDTKVVASMRVGMSGIFMPTKYDDTAYLEDNGSKLYWKDIAEYGFADGERFAFLNSDKGLIFDKIAYRTAASAISLDDIEQYIKKMIK